MARDVMRRIEGWLDQGMGSCILRDAQYAECIENAMHDADGVVYELGCYVVMPNHVHAIVRPLTPAEWDLETVLKNWKGRAAFEINRHREASGVLWQRESYDRIVRDEEHLWRV